MGKGLMKTLLIITIGLALFTIIVKTFRNGEYYKLVRSIDYYTEKNK